jgi:hypothetical protein
MNKDGKPVRDQIKNWVEEQWGKQELGAEALIDHLHRSCVKALGKPAESAIAALIQPLAPRPAPPGTKRVADFPDPDVLAEALAQLDRLLGIPLEGDHILPPLLGSGNDGAAFTVNRNPPGNLEETLLNKVQAMTARTGQKLAEMVVCLIEQPLFRLAGAEEAIRQMSALIEKALQHHEQMGRECAQRAFTGYQNLTNLIQALKNMPPGKTSRSRPLPVSPVDMLRGYAKARYQTLILQHLCALYVALRGQLSDQMLEVGFCRNRLADLARSFEKTEDGRGKRDDGSSSYSSGGSSVFDGPGLGEYLFPPELNTFEEAVSNLYSSDTNTDLQNLDQRIEAVIRHQFTALVHVCLAAKNLLRNLGAAMQREAEMILAERLAATNVVDLYLTRQKQAGADAQQVAEDVAQAFDQARPHLRTLVTDARRAAPREMYLFAAPAEAAGAEGSPRFRDLVRSAVPDRQVMVADALQGAGADEILFYREETCLHFADLKLLGPDGREAYLHLNSAEHFTPHSRTDITEWVVTPSQG